jgi:hypothetical protein
VLLERFHFDDEIVACGNQSDVFHYGSPPCAVIRIESMDETRAIPDGEIGA